MCCLLYTFPLTSAWLQKDKPDDQTNTTEVATQGPVVYLGQESSGVSSLLFQCAVSQANRDIMVTYISPRPFSRMPLSVHGMPCPSSASSLKTLTFQYLSSPDELVQFCSNVHMRVLHPQVLITGDMQYYIEKSKGQGQEAAAARLCALLLDTVHFIHKKSPDSGCCLLVSCQTKIKSLQAVFRQFKFNIMTIENYVYNFVVRKRQLKTEVGPKMEYMFRKQLLEVQLACRQKMYFTETKVQLIQGKRES